MKSISADAADEGGELHAGWLQFLRKNISGDLYAFE
jgi:hypothetical protein